MVGFEVEERIDNFYRYKTSPDSRPIGPFARLGVVFPNYQRPGSSLLAENHPAFTVSRIALMLPKAFLFLWIL
jgi:hypothetical protein